MAGICFFYESADVDVWSGKNLDAWHYAAQIGGEINKMTVINRTDQIITTPNANLDFQVVKELPELSNAVYFTPPWHAAESLWDINHDIDWYVFGPAEGWRNVNPGRMVSIGQQGTGAPHSVHVATTVMFHRFHSRNT